MRKSKVLSMVIIGLSFVLLMALNTFAEGSNLYVKIHFVENFFFSTYDVHMFIDGKEWAVLPHGEDYEHAFSNASTGNHRITFTSDEDASVKGETTFAVDGDTLFQCTIEAHFDRVSISDIQVATSGSQSQQTLEESTATDNARTDNRPQREGTSNQRIINVGLYQMMISDYWLQSNDVDFFRAYAETGNKVAMLEIHSDYDENDPVGFEWLDTAEERKEIMDSFFRSLEVGGAANCELISETAYETDTIQGALWEYSFLINGTSGTGINFMFPSQENNHWVAMTCMVTDNADYRYNEEFERIISSIVYSGTELETSEVSEVSNDSANNIDYSDPTVIIQVQDALNKAGYECGTADGVAGNKTKGAISNYRNDHGLTAGDHIDEELVTTMGLAFGSEEVPVASDSGAVSIEELVTGQLVTSARNQLAEYGYSIEYEHAVSHADFTSTIEAYSDDDLDSSKWIVTGVKNLDRTNKTIVLLVSTEEYIQEKSAQLTMEEALEDKLEIVCAVAAVELYGKKVYPYGFKLNKVTGKLAERAVDENTWFIKYICTIENEYNNKAEYNCEAYVSGTTDNPVVTDFRVY